MDSYSLCIAIMIISLAILAKFLLCNKQKKQPPSPPSLPIIGHLHLFKKSLHRTLSRLADRYDPIFLLFGSRHVLVVSSYLLAEECFTKNEIVSANCPRFPSAKHLSYNYSSIGSVSYGPLWRNLRRIATVELLSFHRLNSFAHVRSVDICVIVRRLFVDSKPYEHFTKVELKSLLFELTMVTIVRMIAGKMLVGSEEVAVFVGILTAGTDTTSSTIEWAMTLLLNNPNKLRKIQVQIDQQVGLDALIQESGLSKLPYLHCIIFESLRLYPVLPLLIPHESSEECVVGGYDVPRGVMLLVNAYAIHRDAESWLELEEFEPERFQDVEREGAKMLPFGMGRRRCPGEGHANRVVGLVLGNLIQCFDWVRAGEELIDMGENSGITLSKAIPLETPFMISRGRWLCKVCLERDDFVKSYP